jgi:glycosyltransferase involved in cell wall biosynthesis
MIGMDIRKYYDYGIGTYIQNLVRIFQSEKDIDFVYYVSASDKRAIEKTITGLMVMNHSPKYSIKELFSLSADANKRGLEVFHSPHYTLPLNLRMPSVVTIHDINHLRLKEYYSLPKRLYAYSIIKHACSASSAIIVDSKFVKEELLDVFTVEENKIHVVPLGVHDSFYILVDDRRKNEFLSKYSLSKPYILYTGNLKPHKNIPVLLKAFKKVLTKHTMQLAFAGGDLLQQPILMNYIVNNDLQDSIVNLGRLGHAELAAAYQASSMVVLPSFYEGFGFSMVEAMASGIPAVGARTTSIVEVVGGAGLLFDPKDENDLCSQIMNVVENPALQLSLIEKGKMRANLFTWERCAEQTLHIYKEVVQ